jgi:hypothetical protein
MLLNKIFPMMLLILLSASCAKSQGKTGASFNLKIAALTDLGTAGKGGAMLWGRSDKGDMFGVVIDSMSPMTLELANGSWSFWSVAWEGVSVTDPYGFKGKPRCSKTSATLNGVDAQVNITLNNSTCADPDFTPSTSTSAGYNQFPDVANYDCNKLTDFAGSGCGNISSRNGKTTSRRLIMPAFKKAAGGAFELTGQALVSECNPSSYTSFSNEHLPLGNGNIPAFTVIQGFFSSTSCEETDPKGFVKDNYEYGLKGTNNAASLVFVNEGTCTTSTFGEAACKKLGGSYAGYCMNLSGIASDISQAYCVAAGGTYTTTTTKRVELITTVPDEVFCSGKRVDASNTTPTIFAGGTGTSTYPYKICTEVQLNSIGANYMSSSFTLQNDLDMNVTSIFGSQPQPQCASSNPGMNFTPIGGLYDNNCNLTSADSFGGTFEGFNHTISNIRLEAGGTDNIGFIRRGGSLQNLILNNMKVEGSTYVGAFSGNSASALQNLTLYKGEIRGKNNVGGIAGYYLNVDVSDLHAKKTFVQIENSSAVGGGLIGMTDSASLTMSKSSFEGIINLNAESSYAGGLVGKSNYPTIKSSFSSGDIIVQGSSTAGGLVGKAVSNMVLETSYSRMNIGPNAHQNTTSGYFGGLVGVLPGTYTLSSSFYYGSIMLPCRYQAVSTCTVGAIAANTIVSGTNVYGVILYPDWFNTAPTDNSLVAAFESTYKTLLVALYSSFVDAGTGAPRLSWEGDTCAQSDNNKTISFQTGAGRGSLADPIILCNRDQFASINNYPSLNYLLGDNISMGKLATPITNFYGTINGQNYSLGGLYVAASSGAVGLINTNNGILKNIKFTNSVIDASVTANTDSGLVAINGTSGEIRNSEFRGMKVLYGKGTYQGIVAGENNGKIYNVKVASAVESVKTAGLLTGVNGSSGVITGARVEGALSISSDNNAANFGGVAGVNSGKITEVATSATVSNPAAGNTSSSTFIGGFVGTNSADAVVEDILVEPYATINVENTHPIYGQVFGYVATGTQTNYIKRVVATNDIPVGYSYTAASVKTMTGYSSTQDQYSNSYFTKGSAMQLLYSDVTFSNCTVSSLTYTYTMNSALSSGYAGIYVASAQINEPFVSRRLASSSLTTNATTFTLTPGSGDFAIPCGANGVQSGVAGKLYSTYTDFNGSSEVHAVNSATLAAFSTYCVSSGASSLATGVCNTANGEFDIVVDKAQGFGSQRLINAYKAYMTSGEMPSTRPVWTLDSNSNGYPRLFIAN